ncbi:MAG: right-handed parallel beta-helix repeat-containing protein [Myxococcota bacterium]
MQSLARRFALASAAWVLVTWLMVGCSGQPIAADTVGSAGGGPPEPPGSSGGAGGASVAGSGGTGGSAEIDCAPGVGSVGDSTESPREVNIAVSPKGSVVAVWRESVGATEVWTNRWSRSDGWTAAERLQTEVGPSAGPQVMFDGDGSAVAVWSQSDCASTEDIVARRWTPIGGWGSTHRIDSSAGSATSPMIAVEPSGNVVVVWLQENAAEDGRSVWFNRWTEPSGWGEAEPIRLTENWAWEARVAAGTNGSVYATWREREAGGEFTLWLSQWTQDEGWSEPQQHEAEFSVGNYDLAVGPEGNAVVLFSSGTGSGFDRGLWAVDWAGAWGPMQELADDRRVRDPRISLDADGNAFAVWMYWAGADTGGARIWAARRTPADGWRDPTRLHDIGAPISGTTKLTHGWSWEPELAVSADGKAAVVWEESFIDAEDRQRINAWASQWDEDAGWTEAQEIDLEDQSVSDPGVGFDAYGRVAAAWVQGGELRATPFLNGCATVLPPGDPTAGGGGDSDDDVDPCAGVACPDTECSSGGTCDAETGVCRYSAQVDDGVACSEGECLSGGCGRLGARACTADSIREAIAEGGVPHFFACDEPMRVVLEAPLEFDNDVILDGEETLSILATRGASVRIALASAVEMRGVNLLSDESSIAVFNDGNLTVENAVVEGVASWRGNTTLIDSKLRRIGLENGRGEAVLVRSTVSTERPFGSAAISNHGGTVRLIDSTITGAGFGKYWNDVGAVYNSHIFEVGGVFHEGLLVLENSTITGNRGLWAGAIYNNGASVVIKNSTISNNLAQRGPSIYSWTWREGSVTVINSTISGSEVEYECGSNHNGYAIGNDGTLSITNSTVAANAFGALDNRGHAEVEASVLDGECVQFGHDASTVSGGYNIVGGTDACGFDQPTDQVDVSSPDLGLGPLRNNGGPTMTHGLATGSLAVDAIPNAACTVAEDQRGESRPAGSACDVGAFELQP